MEYRDFVYWLQGYFEIGDTPTLSENQCRIVKRHLAMTLKYNENCKVSSRARDFVNWLDGILSHQPDGTYDCGGIMQRLGSVFLHEIDPSMPDKDGKLQLSHQGDLCTDPAKLIIRC